MARKILEIIVILTLSNILDFSASAQHEDPVRQLSMADTNCIRWRRKTVSVWLIEKGAHAPSLVRLGCCALRASWSVAERSS
jgi:hypothetical protein